MIIINVSTERYWEVEQSVDMIFWIGKGLFKKKHRLHLIWLIILFLKMWGQFLKSYIVYLQQTKLIRGFSQKFLLLDLKTPSLKDHLVRTVFYHNWTERVDLNHVRGKIVHVKYATQLKILQNLKIKVRRNFWHS